MFHVPNIYRNKLHAILGTEDSAGNNGYFIVQHPKITNQRLLCLASDTGGWEHVSVRIQPQGMETFRVPDWQEMCYVKSLFWDEDDCVAQLHVPNLQSVSIMNRYVLHLWRKTDTDYAVPPEIYNGVEG